MAEAPRPAPGAVAALSILALVLGPVRASPRDFATVGRISTRVVESRTLVLVPIRGPVRVRLSEPFTLADRSRLILTIENARLAVGRPQAKQGAGLLSLDIRDKGGDVVVAVEVVKLGEYGLKPMEGGILLWLGPSRSNVAEPLPERTDAGGQAAMAVEPAVGLNDGLLDRSGENERRRSSRLWMLAVAAGLAGWLLRRSRGRDMPAIIGRVVDRSRQWIRLAAGRAAAPMHAERPDDGRRETALEPDPLHTGPQKRSRPEARIGR